MTTPIIITNPIAAQIIEQHAGKLEELAAERAQIADMLAECDQRHGSLAAVIDVLRATFGQPVAVRAATVAATVAATPAEPEPEEVPDLPPPLIEPTTPPPPPPSYIYKAYAPPAAAPADTATGSESPTKRAAILAALASTGRAMTAKAVWEIARQQFPDLTVKRVRVALYHLADLNRAERLEYGEFRAAQESDAGQQAS